MNAAMLLSLVSRVCSPQLGLDVLCWSDPPVLIAKFILHSAHFRRKASFEFSISPQLLGSELGIASRSIAQPSLQRSSPWADGDGAA